jgi:predicted secreted protein
MGSILPIGCAGIDFEQQGALENESAEAMEATPTDPNLSKSLLSGTWIADVMVGRFQTLTLLDDYRYHAERNVLCIKAPCNPVEDDGRFTIYTKDDRGYIVFESNTADVQSFEYALRDNRLFLRPLTEGGTWYFLSRANSAWCDKSTDCDLQNLPPGICSGDYACEESTCAWRCSRFDQSAVEP